MLCRILHAGKRGKLEIMSSFMTCFLRTRWKSRNALYSLADCGNFRNIVIPTPRVQSSEYTILNQQTRVIGIFFCDKKVIVFRKVIATYELETDSLNSR
uniref:AlNc14C441G11671 protein n=1 Tax=Albugo laibachii Nc14 TaxID=890382 RepID=F0WZT0_9STRA|nr:AlNc14C441G11671 [Albugo laibachii Nc14]|eukprot:CCA27007.1 AlNc14C441G11671 [Albugo laibachii Nc14]